MTQLSILYQDKHCVAVDKPPGLLVHRSNIDRHETQFAVQLVRDQIRQLVYPVHRLDKPTSGVLLFALSSEVASTLGEAFQDRTVKKQYVAIVRGHCPESVVMDKPLATNPTWSSGKFAESTSEPLPAVTGLQTMATCEIPFAAGRYPTSRFSLVRLKPQTGRRHQIRRHLKHAAHPIVGDTTHGDHRHNKFFKQQFQLGRMLLHAQTLEFTHPVTQQPITISVPPDDEFQRLQDCLGLSANDQT